ncbi:MAG: signal recognition particle receptor subunit alpha, partial [Candidatus Brocadiales bacterium]
MVWTPLRIFRKKKAGKPSEKKASWFSLQHFKKGLTKTRSKIGAGFKRIFSLKRGIDANVLEEIEALLLEADMGVHPVEKVIRELKEAWKAKEIEDTSQVPEFIKNRLKEALRRWNVELNLSPTPPTVIMVTGVNGVGKTTSIAKLANMFIKDGKKVMLAAADTFRAAAIDQLDIWSKRIGADIVKHQHGADPAAVTFDAIEASIARGIDVLIVDTAGRLHTHENLMNE